MTTVMLLQSMAPSVNYQIPLGLAYVAAALEQKGCEVRVIDASAPYANYSLSDMVREVRAFEPSFIGVSILVTWASYSYRVMRNLKEEVGLPIVAGGPHASAMPAEALENGADIAVVGEGEYVVQELVDYFDGKVRLEDVKGIVYRNPKGEVVWNQPRGPIMDLDALPLPAKHLFRRDDYMRTPGEVVKYRHILTSRGCPYPCTYCAKPALGSEYRYRSPQNIREEIEHLQRTYGLNTFFLVDDNFLVRRDRVMEFCRLLKERHPGIKWRAIGRLDLINRELLETMKAAGCIHLNYGVESGSAKTLKRARRGYTPGEAERALRLTKEVGIPCDVNFMYGFPWETSEDIRTTVSFIQRIAPLVETIAPGGLLEPIVGTKIYEEYKDRYDFEQYWLQAPSQSHGREQVRPAFHDRFFVRSHNLDKNFFDYTPETKREIHRATRLIGRLRLDHYARRLTSHRLLKPIVREAMYAMVCVSRLLDRLDPRVERLVFRPLMYFGERFQSTEAVAG